MRADIEIAGSIGSGRSRIRMRLVGEAPKPSRTARVGTSAVGNQAEPLQTCYSRNEARVKPGLCVRARVALQRKPIASALATA